MKAFTSFIKDIFMISQDNCLIGLSSIKPIKSKSKKTIVKSSKKTEPKLSDLMRRSTNKV